MAWQTPQKRKLGFWWAVLFGVIAGFFAYLLLDIQTYYPDIWSNKLFLPFLIVITAGFITSRITRRLATGTFTGVIAGIMYIGRVIYDTVMYHGSDPIYLDSAFLFEVVIAAMFLGFIGGLLGTMAIQLLMSLIRRTPQQKG